MTDKERENSYERYKQWQNNKNRYEHECVAYILLFGIGVLFVIKNWESMVVTIGIVIIIGAIALLLNIFRKWHSMRQGLKNLENMLRDAGATNVEIDYDSGKIKFDYAPQFTEKKLLEFQSAVSKMGLKVNVSREKREKNNEEYVVKSNEKISNNKSTEIGYINKNRQKNLGKTDKPGTDFGQWFYNMECLDCGHRYLANGSNIYEKKCPNCQGGRL